MIALGVAVIGFLGVALGAVVTGYVTLRQARLATEQEREAQQMLREQQRKDVRDAFQRETLLALQDAIEAAERAVANLHAQTLGYGVEVVPEAGLSVESSIRREWQKRDASLKKLWARVFDAELRSLVGDFRKASSATFLATSSSDSSEHFHSVVELVDRISERIIELLPKLY
jgi:hypothetical protein